ncbi:hypothetical protein BCR42DRAFT_418416 [Absidia repens]|uniref:Uncharacterized protein n=1 Tax=Absidia repens TaxID=90262 RepID=A0A1X2IBL0_9FUNG|nr:hypothetical protein BCR42DRAFT_418416 [Absidia repens]
MDFIKKLTHHHDDKSHSHSTASTTPSSAPSDATEDESPAAHAKYLADPMRTNDHHDSVGHFKDPMGGRSGADTSRDPTNTGA